MLNLNSLFWLKLAYNFTSLIKYFSFGSYTWNYFFMVIFFELSSCSFFQMQTSKLLIFINIILDYINIILN